MSLRQAGVALVAAGGRENVDEAIVAAAREMVGDAHEVRLVLWDGDGAQRRCVERRRRLGS